MDAPTFTFVYKPSASFMHSLVFQGSQMAYIKANNSGILAYNIEGDKTSMTIKDSSGESTLLSGTVSGLLKNKINFPALPSPATAKRKTLDGYWLFKDSAGDKYSWDYEEKPSVMTLKRNSSDVVAEFKRAKKLPGVEGELALFVQPNDALLLPILATCKLTLNVILQSEHGVELYNQEFRENKTLLTASTI